MAKMKVDIYEHLKTGKRYECLGIAANKTKDTGEDLIVYRDLAGILYVRELTDFMKKFDLVCGISKL